MKNSLNVLMVCLGNICRSPLAHGILEKKIGEQKLNWTVDSCGTSGWHKGELPDSRSIEVAAENGIDLSDQRSRQFELIDFQKFDVILVMDSSNFQNVIRLAKNMDEKEKVKLIMNFAYPGENRKVPDPYYEGGFGHVYNLLNNALDAFIKSYN